MQALAEFPYSKDALSNLYRAFVTAFLFVAVWFFLASGDSTSLFEGRIDAPVQRSAEQNLGANLLCALGFSILGFLNFFWICENRRSDLKSVLVLEDRIIAPRQGVSGKPVEISIGDITKIKKLSVKKRWEFHVYGSGKLIRVPKASLDNPEDFERLVSYVQKVADGCELEVEQRT